MSNETSTNTGHAPGNGRNRAVVVGAGFGGLAAAVRLTARGYHVDVVERHDQPGGRARVFRQDGFTFDAGPTVITAPFLFEELWELCDRKLADDVDLRPIDPFYLIRFDDGEVFRYTGDSERMRAEVGRLSPDDVEGYDRFVRMSEQIFKVGFERLGHVHFGSLMDMIRIVPAMIGLQSYRTVYGLVSSYVRDERIRQVLSFHPLLVGGNPLSTTSIYTLIAFLERNWGVHFPIGGTGSLVSGLVNLIEDGGGRLRLSETVEEITTDGQRVTGVRLASGETLPADVVVSNADSAWTYRHLLPSVDRRRWTDEKLDKSRYSMSLFVWYFGTNRQYPDVEHHTILLGPRYKGLLREIFDSKTLADDFSLYLHRPTATDPALAPEGCDAFYVLSPVPNLESDIDWEQAAEPYRKAISDYLEASVMPGLSESIVSSKLFTPPDFRDELFAFRGAAFGLEPLLRQSAYYRPHNRSEEVGGLYLVGAGTHPGAGVPGVLSSARVLDQVVPDVRRDG